MKWLEFILKVLIVFTIGTLWLLFMYKASGSGLWSCKETVQTIEPQDVAEAPRVVQPQVSRSVQPQDRQETFRRLVQEFLQAGKEEYDKGYFEQAVKTFQMAQGYQKHLTATGREQLDALLKKAETAVAERRQTLEMFQAVNKLIKQDQLIEAKSRLESLRNSEFLTKDERAQVTEVLKQIDVQITEEKAGSEAVKDRKLSIAEKLDKIAKQSRTSSELQHGWNKQIAELYRDSMRLYRSGQFEEARKGLDEVASSGLVPPAMKKAIDGYIAEIDKALAEKTSTLE